VNGETRRRIRAAIIQSVPSGGPYLASSSEERAVPAVRKRPTSDSNPDLSAAPESKPTYEKGREWFCVPGDRRQARQHARGAKPEEFRLEIQIGESFAHETLEKVCPLDKTHQSAVWGSGVTDTRLGLIAGRYGEGGPVWLPTRHRRYGSCLGGWRVSSPRWQSRGDWRRSKRARWPPGSEEQPG